MSRWVSIAPGRLTRAEEEILAGLLEGCSNRLSTPATPWAHTCDDGPMSAYYPTAAPGSEGWKSYTRELFETERDPSMREDVIGRNAVIAAVMRWRNPSTAGIHSLSYDPTMPLGTHETVNRDTRDVRLGPSVIEASFSSVEWIGSVLAEHVPAHISQSFTPGMWETGSPAIAGPLCEAEAYAKQLDNAQAAGLTPAQVEFVKTKLSEYQVTALAFTRSPDEYYRYRDAMVRGEYFPQ